LGARQGMARYNPCVAADRPPHSMNDQERALALEVLGAAWERLAARPPGPPAIADVVRATAMGLVETHLDVGGDYARHVATAAIWYLDRAVRRVADPDRSGLTPRQQQANLEWFASTATPEALETLFALAAALDSDDA
jgi:hypothetical protein